MVTFKVLKALGSISVSLITDFIMDQTRKLIKACLWLSWLKAAQDRFKSVPSWMCVRGDWPARTHLPLRRCHGVHFILLGSSRLSLWKKEPHSSGGRTMTRKTTPIFFRAMLELSDAHFLKFLRGSTKRTSRWVSAGFGNYGTGLPTWFRWFCCWLLVLSRAVTFCCAYLYCEYLGNSPALKV